MNIKELEDQVGRGVDGAAHVLKVLRKIGSDREPPAKPKRDGRRKPRPPHPKPRATDYLDDAGAWHPIPKPETAKERRHREKLKADAAALEKVREIQRIGSDDNRLAPSRSPWADVDYAWGEPRYRQLLGFERSDFIGPWQHSREFDYLLEQEHERLELEARRRRD